MSKKYRFKYQEFENWAFGQGWFLLKEGPMKQYWWITPQGNPIFMELDGNGEILKIQRQETS